MESPLAFPSRIPGKLAALIIATGALLTVYVMGCRLLVGNVFIQVAEIGLHLISVLLSISVNWSILIAGIVSL